MKTKKIEWYTGDFQSLRQALSSGVEFSFISPDNKQVSPFAYCKDYLQDAVQGCVHKKRKSIYGFVYDPKKHPSVSLKKTRLLATNSRDIDLGAKINCCLDFLHQIERDLKIRRTTVSLCENPPRRYSRCGVWLFEGGSRWVKSPPMISLYTLLIRLGFGAKQGEPYQKFLKDIVAGKRSTYQSVDQIRLREANAGIQRILSEGDKKIFSNKIEENYPSRLKTTTIHNTCGIIGFAEARNARKFMPSWYKD